MRARMTTSARLGARGHLLVPLLVALLTASVAEPGFAEPVGSRLELSDVACMEVFGQVWQALPKSVRADVWRTGIARYNGRFVLAPRIADDPCDSIRVADYMEARVAGVTNKRIERFAVANRTLISSALRRVWFTASADGWAYGDGGFHHEVYLLLADPNVTQEAFEMIAIEELNRRGMWSDIAYAIMQRPKLSAPFAGILLAAMAEYAETGDVPRTGLTAGALGRQGIYRPALIQSMLDDGADMSDGSRDALVDLLARIGSGHRLTWPDVEGFEYLE